MTKPSRITFSELYPLIAEEIERGNSFVFTAFGRSMLPYIRGGKDRVTLSPVTSPLKKNDIIFYRRKNGVFVLHRIIKIEGGRYRLCGDNQYYTEEGITPENIIALLTKIERNGKSLNLHSLSHRIWCALLPLRRFYLHSIAYLKSKITN